MNFGSQNYYNDTFGVDNLRLDDLRRLTFLTAIYLNIPLLLFYLFWVKWIWGVPSALFLASFFYLSWSEKKRAHKNSEKRLFKKQEIFLMILLLLPWVALSGIGRLGHQTGDYIASNAMLKDLIDAPWPLVLHGQPIVYYVAYYLPSAFAGKLFGYFGADVASVFWAWVGFVLAFCWFVVIANPCRAKRRLTVILIAGLLFMFGGGLDFFGHLAYKNLPHLGDQWEWWNFRMGVDLRRQYSSQSTLLAWVPQHALAPWLIVGMLVGNFSHSCSRSENIFTLAGFSAVGLLWSPFGFLGTMPFWVYFLIRQRLVSKDPVAVFQLLTPVFIGILPLMYIVANKFNFPSGFNLSKENAGSYLFFLFIEWGFFACFLFRFFRREKIFLLVLFLLAVIPCYRIGQFNDFCMRASIPALFLFWAYFARTLIEKVVQGWPRYGYLSLMVLAMMTSGSQLYRQLVDFECKMGVCEDVMSYGDLSGRDVAYRAGDNNALFFRFFAKQNSSE